MSIDLTSTYRKIIEKSCQTQAKGSTHQPLTSKDVTNSLQVALDRVQELGNIPAIREENAIALSCFRSAC